MTSIRLAIASDLHYVEPSNGGVSLPAAANSNPANDPMQVLLARIAKDKTSREHEFEADYLICPGDVTNQASAAGFEEGWSRLKALQVALGARHILATTGNHEVHSRAGQKDDVVGLSTQVLDPLAAIQRHADYPSTCLNGEDRWVYWGRGYQIVEEPNILFVIINSSHFHPTTRANEFERGRISDIALGLLRTELNQRIAINKRRAFIALLHHHPIPHEAGPRRCSACARERSKVFTNSTNHSDNCSTKRELIQATRLIGTPAQRGHWYARLPNWSCTEHRS